MNRIEVKQVMNRYDYPEPYWIIDGKPITAYLDEAIQRKPIPDIKRFGTLLGLLPAWSGELEWQWENDFIWELVDSKEELNVPILVCEDDCDLSCIVLVAHIRKEGDKVYWDKLGSWSKKNYNYEEENQSGILCLETYTDEDWEKYGDNIATEKYNSRAYWKWVKENYYEEYIRRLHNYVKPHMQQDANIDWISEVAWVFDLQEYTTVVEYYRELKRQQDVKNAEKLRS